MCWHWCGDGRRLSTEECDDNNLNAPGVTELSAASNVGSVYTDSDGCLDDCTIVPGWNCTGGDSW